MKMEKLEKEDCEMIANTIAQQLKCSVNAMILGSWGMKRAFATQYSPLMNGERSPMACLGIEVNGFCYQGIVLIAYDEGNDEYNIYTKEEDIWIERQTNVGCDELGMVLDTIIEKGSMNEKEYRSKVVQNLCL